MDGELIERHDFVVGIEGGGAQLDRSAEYVSTLESTVRAMTAQTRALRDDADAARRAKDEAERQREADATALINARFAPPFCLTPSFARAHGCKWYGAARTLAPRERFVRAGVHGGMAPL